MAQQLIDIGAIGNDGSGDSLYEAGNKININFTELFARPSVESHIRMSGNEITSSESNADISLEASGTGVIKFPAINFNGNNIEATRSNDDLKIVPSGTGAVSVAGLKVSGNKILSINSNDDIVISPPGTGAVDFGTFKINDNNIEGQRSNEDIKLIPSGSGKVIIASLGFGGTTISSDDSSSINVNEGLVVDGTLTVSGAATLTGTIAGGSGSQFGNIDLTNGQITNYVGGSISFDNENLTTTGTLSAATGSQFGQLDLLNGTINDSSGAISFGNENISSTGTLTGISTLTATSITTTGNTGLTGTITIDNLTFNDNIIASTSNADINLTPSGTGVVNISNLTIDSSINLKDNVIQVTTSNANIELEGSGSGKVNVTNIDMNAGTVDNVVIGNTTPAAGSFTTLTFSPAASGSLSSSGVTITDNKITTSQSNDNLEITGNGSGTVTINGFTLPSSDGSTGQILRTDGSKSLTFITSPILLGVTDIQDGTAEFTFKSETTVDHVITTGGHELLDSTQRPIHTFASSKYDSIFYHSVTRDDASDELSTNLYSVVHGTSSDSSIEAFVSESHITKTGTNNQLTVDADVLNGTVRLLGTGFNPTCSMSFYAIGLGDDDSSGYAGEPNASLAKVTLGVAEKTTIDHVTESGTNANIPNSEAQLTTFNKTQFDSAWFLGLTKDITNSKLATTKISAVHNNDSVYVSQSSITRTSQSHTFIPTITGDIESATDLVAINGTGASAANSLAYYRIGLGDNDSTGYSGEQEAGVVINTDVDSASETFDSWAHASFRGAKYYISVNNNAKTELTNMEVLVVHDGTDAYVTVYNIVNTNDVTDNLVDVTAAISGSNVVVSMAGFDTNLRVHAYRILLSDAEADRTGTNVNVIGDVDVGNYTVTAADHVTAAIDNTEDFSSQATFDNFVTSKYDSAWYHFVAKDETNGTLEFHKFSVNHGTSSDSSTEAFISDSQVIRTQSTPVVTADADTNNGKLRVRLTGHNDGSTTVNVSTAAYRIGLGDDDSSGYVNTESNTATAVINTDVDSASESFDSWAHASYRGAKYYISINNASKNEISNVEAVVVHNGTDAFIQFYNLVNTGNNDLINLTAAIDGSNVVVSISGVETNLRVHAYRILLSDSESDSTGTNVNVIGNETVTNYVVTTIDHVTATVDNTEDFSSEQTFDQWSSSNFDSAWYHVIVKDETNDAFSFHKYSVCHGTSSDSSAEAFITDSGIIRSETVPIVTANTDVNNGNVRVRLTAHNDGSSAISVGATAYRIALGDNDSTGYSGEQEAGVVINTDVDSASETFDSWAHASFRGAKYYISINNDSKTEVANVEALVVHDGTNAMITTYNEHGTGDNPLATFTAAIVGSNVVVSCAGLETNLRITAYRILLADDEADRTGTNVNVIGEVTVSSSATTLDTFSTNSYQGAHYIIVGTKSNDSCIMEASVISNGSEAFISEGPQVSTQETPMLTLAASHSSTTTTVTAAATTGGSTTVNAYRIHIARGTVLDKDAIDTFASSSYKAGHYIVVGSNADSVSQIAEVTVLTDGTSSFITTGADISTNSTTTPLMTFTTDYTGGNARLLAKNNVPLSTTTVNAYRIHVARGTVSTTDVIDTFASDTYDGAHYLIVGKNESDQSQIAEVTVVTDGSSTFHSVGPTMSTHSSTQQLLTFTSDYSSGNARLLAANTQAATNTKVNAYRIHLKAPADTTQTVDSFGKANARGAKYYVSINDQSNNRVENVQILVVHNGTNAFMTEYGRTNTHSSDLVTFSVDIDSSNNVRLRAVGVTSNTRVHAYRILLADDESDSSSTNVNVIGEVTVSSSPTFFDSFDTGSQQGAYYIIVATKSNDSEISEATVLSDGTDAFVSHGPTVSTEETPLITLAASHASTTTTVTAAATTGASTTVNAYRINVARGASTASQQTTLNEFDASTFRSAAYVMQITDTETPNYEFFEARVTHDGSDAYISKFGRIGNTTTELAAITADISGGNVRLRGQITNTNTTEVKFVRKIMKV